MAHIHNFNENHVSEFFHKFDEIRACDHQHTCNNKNVDCVPLVLADSSRAFRGLRWVRGIGLGSTVLKERTSQAEVKTVYIQASPLHVKNENIYEAMEIRTLRLLRGVCAYEENLSCLLHDCSFYPPLHRDRGQIDGRRRFPQNRVTTSQSDCSVPSVHRYGKVERGYYSNHSHRIPHFHQSVTRPYAKHKKQQIQDEKNVRPHHI